MKQVCIAVYSMMCPNEGFGGVGLLGGLNCTLYMNVLCHTSLNANIVGQAGG